MSLTILRAWEAQFAGQEAAKHTNTPNSLIKMARAARRREASSPTAEEASACQTTRPQSSWRLPPQGLRLSRSLLRDSAKPGFSSGRSRSRNGSPSTRSTWSPWRQTRLAQRLSRSSREVGSWLDRTSRRDSLPSSESLRRPWRAGITRHWRRQARPKGPTRRRRKKPLWLNPPQVTETLRERLTKSRMPNRKRDHLSLNSHPSLRERKYPRSMESLLPVLALRRLAPRARRRGLLSES